MLGLLAAIPGVGPVFTIAASAIGFLLRCTPCMIAIAVGVAWIAGDIHGHRKESAGWSAKWQAAEAQAEHDRLKRDALVKAKMEADANDRVAGVGSRADALEKKVQEHEKEEALRRATGGVAGAALACDLTDSADDKWLSDLRRGGKVKPATRSGFTERLRALGGRSPDPGQSGR